MKSAQQTFIDYYCESKKEKGIEKYYEAVEKIRSINKVEPPFKNHESLKSQIARYIKK